MRALKRFFRHENAGLLFALPACIYMLTFVGYPIISNLLLSLQNVTVANLSRGEKHFIGIANYLKQHTGFHGIMPDISVSDRFCPGSVPEQEFQFRQDSPGTSHDPVDDPDDGHGADFQAAVRDRHRRGELYPEIHASDLEEYRLADQFENGHAGGHYRECLDRDTL